MRKYFVLACFVALLGVAGAATEEEATTAEAKEEAPSKVLELTDKTFHATLAAHDAVLVEFYASWCGHCRAFAPEYERAASLLEGRVPVARIDGAENPAASETEAIEGFPTVRLYVHGRAVPYEGPRTAEDVVRFVERGVEPPVVHLRDADAVAAFVDAHPTNVIACFGDPEIEGSELRNTFFSIAEMAHIATELWFGTVDDPELAGMTKCPMLAVRQPDLKRPLKYDFGDIDADANAVQLRTTGAISRWIARVTTPAIAEISGANIQRYINLALPMVWVIVDPKNNPDTMASLGWMRAIAMEHIGELSFVWLDDSVYHEQTRQLMVSGKVLPSLAITAAQQRFVLTDEEAANLAPNTAREWIQDFIAGKLTPVLRTQPEPEPEDYEKALVKEIVATSFEKIVNDPSKDVLVEFYASWCGHCQALAPIYEELARVLKPVSSLVIAHINAPENDLPQGVSVGGFPTVALFPANNKAEPITFNGARSIGGFVEFLQEHASTKFDLPVEAAEAVAKEAEIAAQEQLERRQKEEL